MFTRLKKKQQMFQIEGNAFIEFSMRSTLFLFFFTSTKKKIYVQNRRKRFSFLFLVLNGWNCVLIVFYKHLCELRDKNLEQIFLEKRNPSKICTECIFYCIHLQLTVQILVALQWIVQLDIIFLMLHKSLEVFFSKNKSRLRSTAKNKKLVFFSLVFPPIFVYSTPFSEIII